MDSLGRHTDYDGPRLDEREFGRDPLARFAEWLGDAERAGLPDPNAMILSTVDPDGAPSSRTVLLKSLEGGAFEFVTNASSRKGVALAHEARVSLLFPWYGLRRQVIVQGSAAPAPDDASDAYWRTRPRGSNVAAWASDQSQPIVDRAELDRRVDAAEARFADAADVPRPPHWGAWLVRPQRIEFWQGRPSRVHDRLVLQRVGVAWTLARLQP